MLDVLIERFNYIPIIILMMTGLYVVIATGNLVKRLVGLSLFQTSVFLLYITIGKVFGGQPPILVDEGHGDDVTGHAADAGSHAVNASHVPANAPGHGEDVANQTGEAAHQAVEAIYSNPLPHVLILTAIVVGVATLAVGLALVVRIREAYGTIEDDALNAADYSLETGSAE